MTSSEAGVAQLNEAQCWARLRTAGIGRVAVVVDGAPEIFPVNSVVDHGGIVFRTGARSRIAGAIGQPVAVEVDGYDTSRGTGWSVMIKGVAAEVVAMHDVIDALDLPLFPWPHAPKPRIVRVEPDDITGRCIERKDLLQSPSRVPARRVASE
jgi:nitroimidazol reductase NimA-like FMN-containing flavoprotein (pyridoxamine 5'-phosphate oxidase superfamily)